MMNLLQTYQDIANRIEETRQAIDAYRAKIIQAQSSTEALREQIRKEQEQIQTMSTNTSSLHENNNIYNQEDLEETMVLLQQQRLRLQQTEMEWERFRQWKTQQLVDALEYSRKFRYTVHPQLQQKLRQFCSSTSIMTAEKKEKRHSHAIDATIPSIMLSDSTIDIHCNLVSLQAYQYATTTTTLMATNDENSNMIEHDDDDDNEQYSASAFEPAKEGEEEDTEWMQVLQLYQTRQQSCEDARKELVQLEIERDQYRTKLEQRKQRAQSLQNQLHRLQTDCQQLQTQIDTNTSAAAVATTNVTSFSSSIANNTSLPVVQSTRHHGNNPSRRARVSYETTNSSSKTSSKRSVASLIPPIANSGTAAVNSWNNNKYKSSKATQRDSINNTYNNNGRTIPKSASDKKNYGPLRGGGKVEAFSSSVRNPYQNHRQRGRRNSHRDRQFGCTLEIRSANILTTTNTISNTKIVTDKDDDGHRRSITTEHPSQPSGLKFAAEAAVDTFSHSLPTSNTAMASSTTATATVTTMSTWQPNSPVSKTVCCHNNNYDDASANKTTTATNKGIRNCSNHESASLQTAVSSSAADDADEQDDDDDDALLNFVALNNKSK